MITCKSCGKENQERFKFCMFCGGDIAPPAAPPVSALPVAAVAPPPPRPSAPPGVATGGAAIASGPTFMPSQPPLLPAVPALSGVAPPPPRPPVLAAQAVSRNRVCKSCGTEVPPEFGFCGSCGQRVAPAGSAPAAPAPPAGGRTMFMNRVAAPAKQATRGKLILIRPDGSEGGTFALQEGENLIGRNSGSLFENDVYLSPNHAILVLNAGGLAVQDVGSLNGVFFKLTEDQELQSGDVFRVGQELLRFDAIPPVGPLDDGTEVMGSPNPGFWGRLSIIIGKDIDGSAFPLFGDAVLLGRERGDILFPEDGYVSGLHARIAHQNGQLTLSDLGSSNGTFCRVLGERAVPAGSYLLMGQQLFKAVYS